jgi:hypothetical protein
MDPTRQEPNPENWKKKNRAFLCSDLGKSIKYKKNYKIQKKTLTQKKTALIREDSKN